MKQIISFEKEIAFKTMIGEITSISLEQTLHFSSPSSIEGDLIVSGNYKMTEASTLEENFQYALPVEIMLTSDLEEEDRNIAIDNFSYEIINEEVLHVYVDILVQGREKIEIEEEKEETIEVLEEIPSQEEQISEQEEVKEEEVRKIESEEENQEEEEMEKKEEEEKEEERNLEDTMKSENDVEIGQNVLEKMIDEKEEISVVKEENNTEAPVMNSIFSAFANTEETYTTYSVYILRESDTIEDILNKYNLTREELSLYNALDELKVGSKLIIPTTMKDAI